MNVLKDISNNNQFYNNPKNTIPQKNGNQVNELIEESKKTKTLNLLGINLNSLSNFGLSSLVMITNLILDNNNLNSFPNEIQKLKNLKKISAKCNHLSFFPDVLFSHSNLEELDLSFNCINSIPYQIKNLRNLIVKKSFFN